MQEGTVAAGVHAWNMTFSQWTSMTSDHGLQYKSWNVYTLLW